MLITGVNNCTAGQHEMWFSDRFRVQIQSNRGLLYLLLYVFTRQYIRVNNQLSNGYILKHGEIDTQN